MTRKCSFIAGMAGLFIFFCGGCSKAPEPVETLLEHGAERAAAGDWSGADAAAGKALKQRKNQVNALLLRAMARNNLDCCAEAQEYAMRAAQLDPKSFLAQYLKGMLLSKNGKPGLALAALREARRMRPDDLNTLILLAESSLKAKKYDAAAGYFKHLARSPEYRSTPYPWNGIGVCYAAHAPRKALAFFHMAERLAPGDPGAAVNLAVICDKLRALDTARSYYRRFLLLTEGKAEYGAIRAAAKLRLESIPNR